MKSVFAILTLALCLSACGCGGRDSVSNSTASTQKPPTDSTSLTQIPLTDSTAVAPKPPTDSTAVAPKPPTDTESPADKEKKATAAVSALGGKFPYAPARYLEKPALEFQITYEKLSASDLEKLRPVLEAVPRGVGLNLNQCKTIDDDAVAKLKGMSNLKLLYISGTSVTPKCLESIKTLENLEVLSVGSSKGNEFHDADLAPLAGLTKLRNLEIYGDKLTQASLVHLKNLTNMRNFRVAEYIGDEGMEQIKGWTKLEVLELKEDDYHKPPFKLTDKGAAHLKSMTSLRKLTLESKDMTDASLTALAGMTDLEKLDLTRCGQITDTGFANLKGLKKLKDFTCQYTHFSDASFAVLKELPGLERVDVRDTRVTKAGLMDYSTAKPSVKVSN